MSNLSNVSGATATATPATVATSNAPATPAKASPAAKAPAPVVPAPASLGPIANAKQPITAQDVTAFINKHCGGNPANCTVVFTGNKSAANPLPFSNMQKAGKRASILWALVNGITVKGQPQPSFNLATYLTYSAGLGASKSNPLDLLAALNGGFSRTAKSWGTGFIKLVANAKQQ